jgi:protein subunit release factor A
MNTKERELIISLTKKDFKIEWFSGTGSGGQHRNKHANCCRITHIKSGLVGISQENKERTNNQKLAFTRLADKLREHYKWDTKPVYAEKNKEIIRTYHEPDNIVRDKVSKHTEEYKKVVDNADVGNMIEARKKALV